MGQDVKKSVIVGNEYDPHIRSKLVEVLGKLDAKCAKESWAVVGSQEIFVSQFTINGKDIEIESETFVGITISGPEDIVNKVVDAMNIE